MRLLVCCLALSLAAATARAEDVSPQALADAVGFLALSPGEVSTRTVLTYRRHGPGFTVLGALDLHDARYAGRPFLVLAREGGFARIVTNPATGGAVWVDIDGLRRSSWTTTLAMLEDLSDVQDRIDIFSLAPASVRRVCPAPGLMEACPSYGKDELGPLRILAQRGDYIQIGREAPQGTLPPPVGWVPIHDEGGRLSLRLAR